MTESIRNTSSISTNPTTPQTPVSSPSSSVDKPKGESISSAPSMNTDESSDISQEAQTERKEKPGADLNSIDRKFQDWMRTPADERVKTEGNGMPASEYESQMQNLANKLNQLGLNTDNISKNEYIDGNKQLADMYKEYGKLAADGNLSSEDQQRMNQKMSDIKDSINKYSDATDAAKEKKFEKNDYIANSSGDSYDYMQRGKESGKLDEQQVFNDTASRINNSKQYGFREANGYVDPESNQQNQTPDTTALDMTMEQLDKMFAASSATDPVENQQTTTDNKQNSEQTQTDNDLGLNKNGQKLYDKVMNQLGGNASDELKEEVAGRIRDMQNRNSGMLTQRGNGVAEVMAHDAQEFLKADAEIIESYKKDMTLDDTMCGRALKEWQEKNRLNNISPFG